MAPQRKRAIDAPVTDETVILPTETIQENQSILQKFEAMEERSRKQDETIRMLTKKVAQANGDISEDAKDSKRKYGFELDGHTRRTEESFEFGYRLLVHERKEKVVISTETIGRPMTSTNYNTGKRINEHFIKVTFHDDSTTEMDAIEYIEQFYLKKALVPDSDIQVKDGKKYYTFRTEDF